MKHRLHMDREMLADLLEVSDITSVSFEEIVELFHQEKLPLKLPEGTYAIDPRNGDRILYHASRSFRPYDNISSDTHLNEEDKDCAICHGETTGILDVTDLSEGFTFINKNLFPVLYPLDGGGSSGPSGDGNSPRGMHFLQWTSSYHDKDWHNMTVEDCGIVMSRLAALEGKLLEGASFPADEIPGQQGERHKSNYVLIIKNYGQAVGASLSHGHQQVILSNIPPRRTLDHLEYLKFHGEPLAAALLRENPPELTIKDFGEAVLLVPAFMRRPYEMFLIMRDWHRSFLHELSDSELATVGEGWHDAARILHYIMPRIGKEVAYNVAAFTGPGTGMYFEFLPYSQSMGGLEQIGLYICQETPARAAAKIRESLQEMTA